MHIDAGHCKDGMAMAELTILACSFKYYAHCSEVMSAYAMHVPQTQAVCPQATGRDSSIMLLSMPAFCCDLLDLLTRKPALPILSCSSKALQDLDGPSSHKGVCHLRRFHA